MEQESFNSKRGLKEVQLKDPNTCEYYKEVGCVKDVCDCYTLVAKQETLEEFIIREGYPIGSQQEIWEDGVRNGAKWQQERMYSDIDEAIWLLKQTTEYEILESFKGKVKELEQYKNR